jgi:threonine dehydratase
VTDTSLPTYETVCEAAAVLNGAAHRTPVLTSATLNNRLGAEVFFKAENFQRTGSFKFRGAFHAIARLDPESRRRGIITYSSGNHAQAIALSARLRGIPATIIMPADAPAVKQEATRGYGANVVLYDRERETREAVCERLQSAQGSTLIPPFNHPHVIAGQGTAARELFEETGPLDALLVCVGGGGLLSGCALAAEGMAPACELIGIEPAAGDDATRSFHTGVLQSVHNPRTIADGAQTAALGSLTFPLIRRLVRDMYTVTDEELLAAMEFLWGRMKIVVEPTGALATAGLLQQPQRWRGRRIGVIISGGNVDLGRFARLRLE